MSRKSTPSAYEGRSPEHIVISTDLPEHADNPPAFSRPGDTLTHFYTVVADDFDTVAQRNLSDPKGLFVTQWVALDQNGRVYSLDTVERILRTHDFITLVRPGSDPKFKKTINTRTIHGFDSYYTSQD